MFVLAMARAAGYTLPLLAAVVFAGVAAAGDGAGGKIDFNRDIRSILSNNCFQCHGPDESERQADLRLDTQEGAYGAVVPGEPEESELVLRITSEDEYSRMPPAEAGKKLTPREIELVTEWVRQGAPFARHWSYVRPERPPLPAVLDESWPRTAVDHFLLARLEREGLQPMPEADRHALIRRVSMDLTGLPPTWEQVEAFVSDPHPDAYERLVDRLLADPAYGEHWARMWLDLARYADSAGYADDPPRTIWRYRDYVIRSFNENKPFDQFTIEQIAGDLLPEATEEQLIATAFHRNTLTNNEGGTSDEEFRNVAVVDRVNTTAAVWMGATMACAQCHTHKYDPITQEEYFEFFTFFNNTQDADRRDESPLLELYSDQQKRQKAQWQTEIEELETTVQTMTPELAEAQRRWEEAFAADLAWSELRPSAVETKSGAAATIHEDASVLIASPAKTEVSKLQLPLAAGKIAALRLEALTDDTLPNNGPGHAGGNFVLSQVKATLYPPEQKRLSGRYVRIEIPGEQKILSLAEVQVFRGSENVAPAGEATQSSTAFAGPAKLAIDGDANGDYAAKSVTHTAKSDNPWWEVDLGSERPLDRIAIWNRTDHGLHTRLADFRVAVLDGDRQVVWEQNVKDSPNPSAELALSGVRPIAFAAAYADHSQSGFEAGNVLNNEDPAKKGWAVAPETGKPHELTLIPASPVEVDNGATLAVTLEFNSQHARHTLGRFRISTTDDGRASQFARTPPEVLAILKAPGEQRSETQQSIVAKHYLSIAPELAPQRDRLASLKKQLAEMKPLTTVPVMRELSADQRRTTKIQIRGNFLDTGAEVSEGVPAVFHPLPADAPKNRLTLARWLVDEENPLTARVIVNRYWEQIFGIGLVRTSEEFGTQGDLPSHPELLDWLATELVRSDWNVKALLRLLVTSAAYRQSSRVTPELLQRDPDNRLVARGPRFRLSAEMVRDQALFAAGLLSREMHGPSVQPPRPTLGLRAAFGGSTDWETSPGNDRYRRGLYTQWRRSMPYPSMDAFDAPSREVCTIHRGRTNTPLQALVTMNDPVYVEAAQALARRLIAAGETPHDGVRRGFRLCLSRNPQDAELNRLVELYESANSEYAEKPDAARELATDPLGPAPGDADIAELAAWTVVGNVLLNLDESMMKR
ncbi:MAG: DUF1553 domain-containing protein [Planctomycetes bacterium]|nr:DUF1553 domain-containing protein [Planctomycetota bacterium]